jgi:hypothetical protein
LRGSRGKRSRGDRVACPGGRPAEESWRLQSSDLVRGRDIKSKAFMHIHEKHVSNAAHRRRHGLDEKKAVLRRDGRRGRTRDGASWLDAGLKVSCAMVKSRGKGRKRPILFIRSRRRRALAWTGRAEFGRRRRRRCGAGLGVTSSLPLPPFLRVRINSNHHGTLPRGTWKTRAF